PSSNGPEEEAPPPIMVDGLYHTQPDNGWVIDESGQRLDGQIVFDLDEDETTDTLDAARDNVNYSIPFGEVRSITLADEPRGAVVLLNSGESVVLSANGDLSDENGGILVFNPTPTYVPWHSVTQVGFDIAERKN
ncbi:MAG: hypothetical protein AAF525_08780, partial [Pseudomonadota bacterium]